MRLFPRIGIALLAATVACTSSERGSASGDVGGALVIALPAEPGTILPPFLRGLQEREISEQIFDVLADIGPELNTIGDDGWTPRLAQSWQWSPDSLSITFTLHPRARWHDGRSVTSRDVAFAVALNKDPATGSRVIDALADVDSVSTPDSLTAVVWYARRSPEQFYNVVYNVALLPEHLLRDADRASLRTHPFAQSPVGSGPFRFVRWEPRSLIEVVADSSYYLGRPRLDKVIWTLNVDPNTALEGVLAGDVDLFETLSTDALARIAQQDRVRALPYTVLNYGYLGFNLRDPKSPARPHPLFGERQLRRAIGMSLNVPLLVANVYDSTAVVAAGPFSHLYPTADTTIAGIAFDSAGADRLLDSLGWKDSNGDGVREKNGRTLRFGISLPSSSTPRRRFAELIQAQLRPHGIKVDVDLVEITVFGPRVFSSQFDAIVNNWGLDPSPANVRGHWHTAPDKNRGQNLQLYSNPVVDAALDSAAAEWDSDRSRELYRKAYQAISDDVPAVWLYENRPFMAIHHRVQPDLSAPDAWWRKLRLWSIPSSKRLPRDG